MKRIVIGLCLLFIWTIGMKAQLGISTGFADFHAASWENEFQTDFNNANYAGVHYWINIKNVRLSFLPELFYAKSKMEDYFYQSESSNNFTYHSPSFNLFGIMINSRIYPLDFKGDCDCPTFSKQGKFIDKGFFLELSPVISMLNKKMEWARTFSEEVPTELMQSEESDVLYGLGFGAGIDIGISKWLTLSPFVRYVQWTETVWDLENCVNCDTSGNKSNLSTLLAGLQFQITWNK